MYLGVLSLYYKCKYLCSVFYFGGQYLNIVDCLHLLDANNGLTRDL